jgi:hypothetical protein
LPGGELVGEAVAAQQQGGVFAKMALADLDEVPVLQVPQTRADVAEDLVAPRVRHGLAFAERAGILVFAHRRMVGSELADGAVPDEVEAGIAHVADGDAALFEQGEGKDAGHAAVLLALLGAAEDTVVGRGDGHFHAIPGGGGVPLHGLADSFHGGLGGQLAGCLPAHAIHHQKKTAGGIHPIAILVVFAQHAGIGGRARERCHERPSREWARTKSATKTRKARTNGMCRLYSCVIGGPRR